MYVCNQCVLFTFCAEHACRFVHLFQSIFFVNNIGFSLGPPSVSSKFPEIVVVVKEFIGQHSAAAYNQCREDTEYCHGVSIEKIRRHVLQAIPELKKISKSTIRRLLLPPQKNTKAACWACWSKTSTEKKWPFLERAQRFRFTCAQVNFIGELFRNASQQNGIVVHWW